MSSRMRFRACWIPLSVTGMVFVLCVALFSEMKKPPDSGSRWSGGDRGWFGFASPAACSLWRGNDHDRNNHSANDAGRVGHGAVHANDVMKTECGEEVNMAQLWFCRPGVEDRDFDSAQVGGIAGDEGEVVCDGGCGEEGVDDGARAVGGDLTPKAGGCGVDGEDVIGEA